MQYEAFRLLLDEEPDYEVPARPVPAPSGAQLLVLASGSPTPSAIPPLLVRQPSTATQQRPLFLG